MLLPARLVARHVLLPEPVLLVPNNRVFGKFSKGRENLFSESKAAILVFVGELTPEFLRYLEDEGVSVELTLSFQFFQHPLGYLSSCVFGFHRMPDMAGIMLL